MTGAAHLPRAPAGAPETWLRLEGFEASVARRATTLARALAEFAPARVEPRDWAAVRDAAAFAGREGAVWRVSVKPTDGPKLGAALPEAIYDWAGGLVWALVPEDFDLRAAMTVPGHATLVRASETAKARWGVFHPEPAPIAAIAAGLRTRFDPHRILNPGRMAGTG